MPPTNANDPLRTTVQNPIATRLRVAATAGAGPPTESPDVHVSSPTGEPKGTTPERHPVSHSVPGYEIERVLGRGGMGVVYQAQHMALKRTVALKMMLAGGHAGPHELTRFRIEAEAVARLQHPNIVQIYEVGEAGGHPYCALEFVDGGNLAGKLQGKPMPAKEAASLVEPLARAMQLAHSRNVVHRDLKPANILLTTGGTPKITDFGLARQMDHDSGETRAGDVMGTPSYMAPEQASGHAHEAGPAADIYSLGAILYDCLTGRPPFRGKSVVDTLDQVRTQEPTAPSRLQVSIPLDLETICLKCLSKEPENRYASAAALADELVRYLKGEPILARPVGRVERAVKWVKRNPVVTGAVMAVMLAIAVGTTVSYLKYVDAQQQRREANEARKKAEENERTERWGRYRSNIAAAAGALQLQNSIAARNTLDDAPEEHRNWEWKYLSSQLDGASLVLSVPGGKIFWLAISPSGRQIAVCCENQNEVYLYDVATGKLDAVLRGHSAFATFAAYRPDGKQVATASVDRTIRLWDPETGQPMAVLNTEGTAPEEWESRPRVTYNSDGSRIACWVGTSRLWDTNTGKELAVMAPLQDAPCMAAFSPDGKRVATASDEYVFLWDAVTGRRLSAMGPRTKPIKQVAISPDGKRIASHAYRSDLVHLWDGESGEEVAVLRGHTGDVDLVEFSRDGSRLVSWCQHPENAARIWDATSGRLTAVLTGHRSTIFTVAFSPDGQRLVTGSIDQTARLWDGRTGQLLAVMRGHSNRVRDVLFSPNGNLIITASDDATLGVWDSQTAELMTVLRGHGGPCQSAPVFTPDGSRLISGSHDGTVRIWDMTRLNGILRGHESYVYDVAFSPDGEQVASVAWDGTARLWDATTGRQTGLLKHETNIIGSVAYSRDGRRLVTKERERGVTLWDVASQTSIRNWRIPTSGWIDPRATLNPAGTVLAAAGGDRIVRLWDVSGGQEITQLKGQQAKLFLDVAFHPDGSLFATGEEGNAVRLWDAATHAPLAVLSGHTGSVWRVAFSADGKLLASGSDDKTIRLWDVQTREPVSVIPVGSNVFCVEFSPDGTRLAAACRDRTIRLYDADRRELVAELLGHIDYVHAVAWSPDGTRLVSGSGDSTVRVWDSLSPRNRAETYNSVGGR